MSKPEDSRRIPTFGRRRGRSVRGHKQELVEAWKSGSLEVGNFSTSRLPNFPTSILEIGFGGGEHLAAQALAHPGTQFIGCETYIDGVASLLSHIFKSCGSQRDIAGSCSAEAEDPATMQRIAQDYGNITIHHGDARDVIDALPDAALSCVYILFPDPWPKTRHHKRRLIQQEFLNVLARVMKPGAELRLATDHVDYLTWMLAHLLANPHFTWLAERKADWETPPPGWVRTRYQEKAEREGRGATYLRFVRV